MEDMVRSLAALPDEQRRTMLRDRLDLFYEQPEGERKRGMEAMVRALEALSPEDRQKLVRSRLECLCEFPATKREALMRTHMAVLQAVPEATRMVDMGAMKAAIPTLSPANQATIREAMAKLGMQM